MRRRERSELLGLLFLATGTATIISEMLHYAGYPPVISVLPFFPVLVWFSAISARLRNQEPPAARLRWWASLTLFAWYATLLGAVYLLQIEHRSGTVSGNEEVWGALLLIFIFAVGAVIIAAVSRRFSSK